MTFYFDFLAGPLVWLDGSDFSMITHIPVKLLASVKKIPLRESVEKRRLAAPIWPDEYDEAGGLGNPVDR